jgi:hypothetical protein
MSAIRAESATLITLTAISVAICLSECVLASARA